MQTDYWEFGQYGLPAEVLTRNTAELDSPGEGEALVNILSVGLNRSEFNYVQGKYAPVREFPSCLGQEAVGEIIALGAAGTGPGSPAGTLEVGQRVALLPGRIDMQGMGTYRSAGIYPQNALAPVPQSYSNAEGAGLWMGVLTMGGALELAGVTADNASGKTVLITAGASSMGVIALKLLRAWGAHTIATTRDETKVTQLATLADKVLTCENAAQLAAQMQAIPATFDVALDPVGEAFYPGMIEAAATGATIVSYEMISGREPTLPIAPMMIKDLCFKGYTIFRPYRIPGLLEQLIELGLRHAEELRPVIAREFPLAQAPEALVALGESHHLGKIVLNAS